MVKKVEVSHRTIIFAVLFLIFVWFLYYIRDIIFIFFVALLLTAVLNPVVSKITHWRVPRPIAVVAVYLLLMGVLSVGIGGLIPPLVDQTTNFANNLPSYLGNIGIARIVSEELVKELVVQLGALPGQVLKFSLAVFSNILSLLMIMIIAFYLLLVRDRLNQTLSDLMGESKKELITKIMDDLEKRLGGWARGEISLMVIVGLLCFLGLVILGVPYSIPLGILAGVLELIPSIGPVLSAIPAVIIGFGISPYVGVAVVALYFLVQQIENYVIVPKVMGASIGVNPVIIIFCLAIGFRLAGVAGAIISVPVFLTTSVLVKELLVKE